MLNLRAQQKADMSDQHSLHLGPTTSSAGILRICIGIIPAASSTFELLRLPMLEPTEDSFRIRRKEIPFHA